MSINPTERYSGHESFVCRYGWLPKVFTAIKKAPDLLRNEEQAMHELGIGRNMVKSLQFWAEAAGIVVSTPDGHVPGPVGIKLFGDNGWDAYLENLESLWLIHWQLSTRAGIAAWNEVFGEGKLIRFDRQRLVADLAQRSAGMARPLAASTLDQHASIFLQSYYQAEKNMDDTSWCPLQDLGLIKAAKSDEGRLIYNTDPGAPVGLSPKVFGAALIDFIRRQTNGSSRVNFTSVLKGSYSPGVVFRLSEHQLRHILDATISGPLAGSLIFSDTADTQDIVLTTGNLNPECILWAQEELA